jgi:hypothetical protein
MLTSINCGKRIDGKPLQCAKLELFLLAMLFQQPQSGAYHLTGISILTAFDALANEAVVTL